MRTVSLALTSLAIAAALSGAVLAQVPIVPQPGVKPVEIPLPATSKVEPNRQPPAAVKVDIVLSRTNDNKTLSSLPYSLSVAEGRRTSLRLGSQVPIPMGEGGPISYQSVGSNIDCDIMILSDGRYRLNLTVDDSSLAEGAASARPITPPVIRSYRIDTLLVLRNGETTTFNVSTDKVSGDTIRAQVTVTALK